MKVVTSLLQSCYKKSCLRQADLQLGAHVAAAVLPVQATQLYEALTAARTKYYLEPRREARGWKVTPVLAAEQQVRGCHSFVSHAFKHFMSLSSDTSLQTSG
jgi:hypothetical protein